MKMIFLSIFVFLFLNTGCAKIELPKNQIIAVGKPFYKPDIKQYPQNDIPYVSLLKGKLSFPKAGEKNLYGVKITKELEDAYFYFVSGDVQEALKALNKAKVNSKDSKTTWFISFLKVKIFLLMGAGDDAIEELVQTEKLEKETFNSNLNTISLRGEVKIWLEDYDGAKKDFFDVLSMIGDWEFPTNYSLPPPNMDNLASTTTAQLRAFTGLSAVYTMIEDYKEALFYASEAEKRFNAVHYVTGHIIYKNFIQTHLDSFYGRASNLMFLATAQLAVNGDNKESEKNYEKAQKLFDKINYAKGYATILALKANVYYLKGNYAKAQEIMDLAIKYSAKKGFYDFLWRIETIRGKTLFDTGDYKNSEDAYRKAQATINLISGSLTSDSSKRSFGVGKDDISYRLIQFDILNRDYNQLFKDMEISRSRAFVDMLSGRIIANNKNSLLKEIREIDKKIIKKRLILSSIGIKDNNTTDKLNDLLYDKVMLIKRLEKENPSLSTTVSIWAGDLKHTQSNLKDSEAILYFLPSKKQDKIKYLYISKNKTLLKELNITSNNLQNQLDLLSKFLGIDTLLSSRGLNVKKNNTISKNNDIKTLEDLIVLFENEFNINSLNIHKKVYIIPNGVTNFIPWGMIAGDFSPMVLPTASWINMKNDIVKSTHPITIVGNPNFGGKLPQLSGAEDEAKYLGDFYKHKPLIGDFATESNIRDDLASGAKILHLATHGIFYQDKPLESAIFLTKNSKAVALTAKEIYANPLKANIVILSACETGLGKSSSGNDLLGLTRSFFLGGSKAVLSSLWSIDDDGTTEFMKEFHKYAKDGKYSQGYLKARDALKNKGYSPAIYGAFILNGMDGY
ncbi:MAG: CHAT domain-containing tetratricopeptide repeat protein [Campylobacterota bacterium]|nr:CHAT domain-containing tetratricopeptide repeat protein [Campylobacterota bacterium]